MTRSRLVRAVIFAGFLCFGVGGAAAQTSPRVIPPPVPVMPSSRPMSDATRPENEIARPSRAAAEAPPAAKPVPQKPRARVHATICGNPKLSCRTEITFQPWDLPFHSPRSSVIYDTELFYAVILKSLAAPDDSCDIFVSENERQAAQALFPDRKVFASRCAEPDALFYTNTRPNYRIMALYAGRTLAEANRTLAAVKAAGKFPGAYVRQMRTGFNGT